LYRKAKNRSRQEALGAIRKRRLMVLYPPIFDRSTYFRSFSAACQAPTFFRPFAARLKPCPCYKTAERGGQHEFSRRL
jgi:hypothetical protein